MKWIWTSGKKAMPDWIEYVIQDGEALILRCYGTGSTVELTGCIGDLQTGGLADHCFAPEPSRFYREVPHFFMKTQTGRIFRSMDSGADLEGPAVCQDTLKEVILPSSLRRIGNYAFYGCRNLETIQFPAGSVQMGSGAFVACNHIKTLVFPDHSGYGPGENPDTFFAGEERPAESSCMRDVLGEITYEVEAVVKGEAGYRLYFPGYYEDSRENTPARIIEVVFEGTGFKYRQCFRNGIPDFARYDSLFYLAGVQELPETVIRIALDRLMYPVRLSPDAKKRYLSWLEDGEEWAAAYILREENDDETKILRMLAENGWFSPERLRLFLNEASEKSRIEAVAVLMEEQRRCRSERKKKYLWT